jgi:hypothetical protein
MDKRLGLEEWHLWGSIMGFMGERRPKVVVVKFTLDGRRSENKSRHTHARQSSTLASCLPRILMTCASTLLHTIMSPRTRSMQGYFLFVLQTEIPLVAYALYRLLSDYSKHGTVLPC